MDIDTSVLPKEWAGYLALVVLIVQVIGRAWWAWNSGGGWYGIRNSFLYGTNASKVTNGTDAEKWVVKTAGGGRIAGVLLALSLVAGAQAADSTSPTITVNANTAVNLVKTFPGFDGVGTFAEWFKALGTNTTFQAVYSFSTEGGLSSGGVAIAESLVDFRWEVETGSVWALHLGPALVLGNDDTGVFSAAEAALWTDAFGPLFTAAEKSFGPLSWRPKQIDKLYLFLGAGVETCGDADAGHAFIVSAGVGVKF